MVILFSISAFVAKFLGGIFALRFRDKLHLILGFSAGAVIGVSFFDLIPESIELAEGIYSVSEILAIVGLGFSVYLLLDRFIVLHSDDQDDGTHHVHRGFLGAGSLSLHSFLDGVAIGLAFHVSNLVGIVVALTVLSHSFVDGINTVNVIAKNGGSKILAFKWLLISSLAPFAGVISTLFFSVTEATLGVVLALFAGFFLYIGASELLPESHHSHPAKWTTIMTLFGMAVLYAVVRVAG